MSIDLFQGVFPWKALRAAGKHALWRGEWTIHSPRLL